MIFFGVWRTKTSTAEGSAEKRGNKKGSTAGEGKSEGLGGRLDLDRPNGAARKGGRIWFPQPAAA